MDIVLVPVEATEEMPGLEPLTRRYGTYFTIYRTRN